MPASSLLVAGPEVGVTTVGDIRAVGGDVIPSPTRNNPNHATLSGITAEQAQNLMTQTQRNPSAKPKPRSGGYVNAIC